VLGGARLLLLGLFFGCGAWAADSRDVSFSFAAPPVGWEVVAGTPVVSGGLTTANAKPLNLRTTDPQTLPCEVTFRVRLAERNWGQFRLTAEGEKDPLLAVSMVLSGDSVRIGAQVSGRAMATQTITSRSYSQRDTPTGRATYSWRFPAVRNLWDDRDRSEIGSAYDRLVPLAEKWLALRLLDNHSMSTQRQTMISGAVLQKTQWNGI